MSRLKSEAGYRGVKAPSTFFGHCMQLIWVTRPAGPVVKFAITTRTVALWVTVVASFFLILGFVFHGLGWRVALAYVPELAHRLGGVTSQTEQDKIEATYRAKLEQLALQLTAVNARMSQLENTQNEVLGRVGLDKFLSFSRPTPSDSVWGQGGPVKLLSPWRLSDWHLDQQLDRSLLQAQRYDQVLAQTQSRWDQDLKRLHGVPTQLPIAGDFTITSSFGFRFDPLTQLPSLHEGIDLVAPVGTPVLATAAGEVTKAEYAHAYGHWVEVRHADGFATRYAHLQSILVQAGDRVAQQAPLGTLGNSGRSTGAHLHYEVHYKGQPMHPTKAMAAWARD